MLSAPVPAATRFGAAPPTHRSVPLPPLSRSLPPTEEHVVACQAIDHVVSTEVTLIQRFGPAANLNIHLHCLVLDGVYRTTEGLPVFHEAQVFERDFFDS